MKKNTLVNFLFIGLWVSAFGYWYKYYGTDAFFMSTVGVGFLFILWSLIKSKNTTIPKSVPIPKKIPLSIITISFVVAYFFTPKETYIGIHLSTLKYVITFIIMWFGAMFSMVLGHSISRKK